MSAPIDDSDEPQRHHLVDDDGVRVQADMCSTCIFRPGNLMYLEPGRVRDMVNSAIHDGDNAGSIVCHKTLDLPENAICRGFWDRYRERVQLLQLAERMGFYKEIAVTDNG